MAATVTAPACLPRWRSHRGLPARPLESARLAPANLAVELEQLLRGLDLQETGEWRLVLLVERDDRDDAEPLTSAEVDLLARLDHHRVGRLSESAGKIGIAGLAFGAIFGWGFRNWAMWGESLFLAAIALLLLAALSQTDLSRGLASRPLVWLGRRSYSLYLWHLPVIAAASYLVGNNIGAKAGAVIAATAIAALSYRFVEQPFRHRRVEARTETTNPSPM